jgi:hypothetical protein
MDYPKRKMLMTKKELNKIKAAAFEEFKSHYTDEEFCMLFAGVDVVTVWKVKEGERAAIWVTQYDTQVNKSTLADRGFSEFATVNRLFLANRKTKCIKFIGE